jgi:hypothetical protein
MNVRVFRIRIPAGSTIGYGNGIEVESGDEIHFCADHRAIRYVGEILREASQLPKVYIEPWQIL